MNQVRSRRAGYLVAAVCLVLCLVMVLPLVMALMHSLKTTAEASASPPTYLPHQLSLSNYQDLWEYQAGLPQYLFNSFGTSFLAITFTLGLTVPAGYGLARFPIRFKEVIFVFMLLALIIPYQALLTPLFLMFAQLKLTNTLIGLAIVHTVIQLPFSLYIMRNSFTAVPKELEDAAVADGANSLQVLVRIFLPAVVPAVVTVALFAFVTSWNEFLGALVMMSNEKSFTLPIMLSAVRNQLGGYGSIDWGMLQAGVIVSIIPCVLIYVLLQRYYVSGLTSGAVK